MTGNYQAPMTGLMPAGMPSGGYNAGPALRPGDFRQLTQDKEIRERLKASIDGPYYNSLHKLNKYAFGFDWEQGSTNQFGEGEFPDFPAIDTTSIEAGQLRGVFVNQFIALIKSLSADPRPMFPQLDEVYEELRRELFLKLYRDNGGPEVAEQTFFSGNGVGQGFTRFGFEPGANGTKRAVFRYQSPENTLHDAHERDFHKARWVGFLIDMPVDEAKAAFPGNDALIDNNIAKNWYDGRTCVKRVRVLEYYDKQTRAVYIGKSVDAAMCLVQPEPTWFPGYLPCAVMQYLVVGGFARPLGTIILQMAAAEELKDLYGILGASSRTKPLDIVDFDKVDEKSYNDAQSGKRKNVKRKGSYETGDPPVVERIPAPSLGPDFFAHFQEAKNEFSSTGNANEYERNVLPQSGRTLGEVELYNAKTAGLGSWTQKQTINYLADFVEKFLMCVRIGHTEPIELDYQGQNILFNDPNEPMSALHYLLDESSKVLIDETSVQAADAVTDMKNGLAKLSVLWPGVQQGVLSVEQYWTKALTIVGEKDVSAWLNPQGASGGMPMPGPGGGGPQQDLGQSAGTPQPMVQTPVPA